MRRTAMIAGIWMGVALAGSGCAEREPAFDVQAQIRLLQGTDEEGRWEALANLRDAGAAGGPAVEILKTMLRGTKDEVLQSEIARALTGIGSAAAPALPKLAPLTKDADADVAEAAREAVRRIQRAQKR